MFKFPNIITENSEFMEAVADNWKQEIVGKPMYVLWKKLQRLQLTIKLLAKPLAGIRKQVEVSRDKLKEAQLMLVEDKWNVDKINQVKHRSIEVIMLSNIEEDMLKKRPKTNWIRLGNNNNEFFLASLKNRQSSNYIGMLKTKEGVVLTE